MEYGAFNTHVTFHSTLSLDWCDVDQNLPISTLRFYTLTQPRPQAPVTPIPPDPLWHVGTLVICSCLPRAHSLEGV